MLLPFLSTRENANLFYSLAITWESIMRKLFRFKYEPCNKTCYAYCSKLMKELRTTPEQPR